MSRGVNKVILIGNIGQAPTTRFMDDGKAITNLTIATSESWKDKSTGEKKEQTEWHKVVMYGRLAEIASEYLKKGSKVYVEGKLTTKKWQNKEGVDQYTTSIQASDLQMLDGKSSSQEKREDHQKNTNQPVMATDDFDDDIPF